MQCLFEQVNHLKWWLEPEFGRRNLDRRVDVLVGEVELAEDRCRMMEGVAAQIVALRGGGKEAYLYAGQQGVLAFFTRLRGPTGIDVTPFPVLFPQDWSTRPTSCAKARRIAT